MNILVAIQIVWEEGGGRIIRAKWNLLKQHDLLSNKLPASFRDRTSLFFIKSPLGSLCRTLCVVITALGTDLKCSFTTCKLRFVASFCQALSALPMFFRGSLAVARLIPRRITKYSWCLSLEEGTTVTP